MIFGELSEYADKNNLSINIDKLFLSAYSLNLFCNICKYLAQSAYKQDHQHTKDD